MIAHVLVLFTADVCRRNVLEIPRDFLNSGGGGFMRIYVA